MMATKIREIPEFDPDKNFFVFCHIPKSGGTTLHSHLEALMPGGYIHIRPGIDWQQTIDSMVGAGGHQMNGQSPLFSAEKAGKTPLRMIVLREPLERFLSFYRHIQDHPNHYLASRPGVRDMSPSEFAIYCRDEGVYEFDNLQSKYVVGPKRDHTDLSLVLETFEAEFPLYAPLESFNAIIPELNRIFGKDLPLPKSRNVSTPREISEDMLRETADVVYSSNFNDLQLYLFCCRRFIKSIII